MPLHGRSVSKDLRDTERALRRARPELPQDRMASLAGSAMGGGPATSQPASGRTRFGVVALLVCGLLFSGGAGALAVSGIGGEGATAALRVYAPNHGHGHLGHHGGDGSGAAKPFEQQEAGSNGSQLPFTGWAALPLLGLGLVLLGGGVVLRRSVG